MLDANFYNLTQSLWGAFFSGMVKVRNKSGENPPTVPPLLQVQAGRAESPGWFLVQAAEFDPEPLTLAGLRVRDIYASERIVSALLEVMAAEKWFDRQGEAYHLTENGRSLIQEREDHRNKWMAALDTFLETDIARLEALLSRVLNACLKCDDPPGNWSLVHSRNRAPANDAALSVKLYQYVADINAFRDDAHMAAWRPLNIEGFIWEAFSFVAGDQADNAADLLQQLSYRGYSRTDYADALRQLENRGWLITVDGSTYHLTTKGKEVQTEVERFTDEYFYTPWQLALNPDDIADVGHLVVQLRDELQGIY